MSAIVCTAATDGVCGVALEMAGFDVPIGSLLGAANINGAEGAVDYAVSGGCHSWTGLQREVGVRGLIGLGEGAFEEFVPLFQAGEGTHAITSKLVAHLAPVQPLALRNSDGASRTAAARVR